MMEKIKNIKEFSLRSGIPVPTIKYWNSTSKGPNYNVTKAISYLYEENEWYSVAISMVKGEISMHDILKNISAYTVSKGSNLPARTVEYWKNGNSKENVADLRYLLAVSENQEDFIKKVKKSIDKV